MAGCGAAASPRPPAVGICPEGGQPDSVLPAGRAQRTGAAQP
eukprot:CAMPEP_0206145506 /NCGR_PEP_ID=MMETSP1473-20131121/27593_1 /ASSEMBLY_ACC=CAM_ASM_001109 /TAXON_ID=1461547 /ORGANISM="Stichococcus sp, Strain RCC1054" /LENGTH=41 /DNA_ID= /DNA_START= /DNA_END= /DNA_ORIENTATION=